MVLPDNVPVDSVGELLLTLPIATLLQLGYGIDTLVQLFVPLMLVLVILGIAIGAAILFITGWERLYASPAT